MPGMGLPPARERHKNGRRFRRPNHARLRSKRAPDITSQLRRYQRVLATRVANRTLFRVRNLLPILVGIEVHHPLRELGGVWPKVFLKHHGVMTDEESHNA